MPPQRVVGARVTRRFVVRDSEIEAEFARLSVVYDEFERRFATVDPDDAAGQRQLVQDVERDLLAPRRWIMRVARRHLREGHRLVAEMSRARRGGFRTAPLRPRRACSRSGRPAGRRTATSRAGPDDPDSASDPPSPRCPRLGVA
jgi:hypothetical protein